MNHVLGVFQRRTSPIDSTVPGIANSASVRKFRIRRSRERDSITSPSRNPRAIRIVAATAEYIKLLTTLAPARCIASCIEASEHESANRDHNGMMTTEKQRAT